MGQFDTDIYILSPFLCLDFKKTKKVKRNGNSAAVQDRQTKDPSGIDKKKKDKKVTKPKGDKSDVS